MGPHPARRFRRAGAEPASPRRPRLGGRLCPGRGGPPRNGGRGRGERVHRRLPLGALVSGVDYVQAVRLRRELRAELKSAMAGLDVVVTAAAPGEAPKIDEVPIWDVFDRPSFTMPFNVAGYPAMSVCAGFGEGGLPGALQMVGKPFAEPTLFRIA